MFLTHVEIFATPLTIFHKHLQRPHPAPTPINHIRWITPITITNEPSDRRHRALFHITFLYPWWGLQTSRFVEISGQIFFAARSHYKKGGFWLQKGAHALIVTPAPIPLIHIFNRSNIKVLSFLVLDDQVYLSIGAGLATNKQVEF